MKFELDNTSSELRRVDNSSAGESVERSRSRLSDRAARSRVTRLFPRILADAFEDSRGYVQRWNARRGGE